MRIHPRKEIREVMNMIDLNEDELQVLRDHVSPLGIVDLEIEDWHKIRPETKMQFCELLSQFYNMDEQLRKFYLREYLGDDKEDPTVAPVNPELIDSTMAIINMGQKELNELSEATQTKLLRRFELIEEVGREIVQKEIDERIPEEVRAILNAPKDEWDALPKSVTEAVLRKFEKMAG